MLWNDLEDVCRGAVAWDVAGLVASARMRGHTDEFVDAMLAAYGDVDDLETCLDAHALYDVIWQSHSGRATASPELLRELYDDADPAPRANWPRRTTTSCHAIGCSKGFVYEGERVSFGSFQRGIHRGRNQRGPALTLTTSFNDPYADAFDQAGALFTYAYRAGSIDQPDNRALRAAHELQTPLVYFRALASSQYLVVAPMFVTADDPAAKVVVLEPGLPIQDMQPGGLVSAPDARAYATRDARIRLHQQRFKLDVMRAYRHRCAICSLRERALVQAAHIVPDVDAEGIAVVNGLALCAIHHLAFDRNLLGIDPAGVVHIADRLLREVDGPMLRTGLQGFHGEAITVPRRPADRPDPHRLESRFERFVRAAA